jgi:hypothetical protein
MQVGNIGAVILAICVVAVVVMVISVGFGSHV